MLSLIHRLELVATQQLRQLARIDPVTLTTVFQQRVLSRIADYEMADMRLEQIMQQATEVPSSKDRFECGKQIASYLGLVPSEESSGQPRRLCVLL